MTRLPVAATATGRATARGLLWLTVLAALVASSTAAQAVAVVAAAGVVLWVGPLAGTLTNTSTGTIRDARLPP
ncbi:MULTISPECIES: hypothetical protein [unclassified Pseudonocardia]|uniref:hypothetical protein n=1 Tax=unclassified Pseudonocardia TaxID=2619320 RepID=UPI0015BDF2EA|nr:hypothetical protein [Pseudonocardia sp. ICBG162]NWJ69864.1 hypothetical protein [Pseudonocardia pini]